MGTESDKKKLTLDDPVDAVTLQRLGEIHNRRLQLGDMLLDAEQEKVKILVEGRRLDDERSRLFAQILSSRGIQPNAAVEVDPETGKIGLVRVPNGQTAPTADAAPAPPAGDIAPRA